MILNVCDVSVVRTLVKESPFRVVIDRPFWVPRNTVALVGVVPSRYKVFELIWTLFMSKQVNDLFVKQNSKKSKHCKKTTATCQHPAVDAGFGQRHFCS